MSDSAQLEPAARAFRDFFDELREAFLERESVLTQIELALLCREHVLITGPPGTAKSAIASAVLSRILDEATGQPSLFAKQLSESTVQTDLIGPVDFKVLTETGRTEYLTEQGMIGAVHAFLDEVFDGRDTLLRSILNVLHERELKHGRKTLTGRFECAVMTSNRYLSEVLARSPELLLAFADRLSFVAFVPKAFARPASSAAMLARATSEQRPVLKARLTLQQVDVLQAAVEEVEVGGTILEGVELLADRIERELQAQVVKLPDYVPTKYFSHRSVVKALWALKAAVVRDRIYRRPDRRLRAELEDLEMLRHFFLLGGPPQGETEALLKAAVDPRERAQLEIIRLEHQIFDEALGKVRREVGTGPEREAGLLQAREDLGTAEGLSRSYQPEAAATLARALKQKLQPGPRHPENRAAVLAAARMLVTALRQRLARGMAGQGEGRGGLVLLGSLAEVVEMCRAVPELSASLVEIGESVARFALQALEMIGLTAEAAEFDDGVRLESVADLALNLEGELAQLRELGQTLGRRVAPTAAQRLLEQEEKARLRVAQAIRRRTTAAVQTSRPRPAGTRAQDPYELLLQESARLRRIEEVLGELDPKSPGLRSTLLAQLGRAYALEVVTTTRFERIDELARAVQVACENLRREGVEPTPLLAECRELIERRLAEHARKVSKVGAAPPVPTPSVVNGNAYLSYREGFSGGPPDGELAGLGLLEKLIAPGAASAFFSRELKSQVAEVELAAIQARAEYLRSWVQQLLAGLPDPDSLRDRAQADRAFDQLVKSRFPLLAMREGELVRLGGSLAHLVEDPAIGGAARELSRLVQTLGVDFASYSKRLLEARGRL